MPSKRNPLGRPPRGDNITPEVIALFRRALELADIWDDCHYHHPCGHRGFCEACSEFIDTQNQLDLLLRRPPWEEALMDATDDDPPEWMDARRAESYRQSRTLYLALKAAAENE